MRNFGSGPAHKTSAVLSAEDVSFYNLFVRTNYFCANCLRNVGSDPAYMTPCIEKKLKGFNLH